MRRWMAVAALMLCVVVDASARGLQARIEDSGRDATTYTVHTAGCDATTALEPWAYAEGVVDGRLQSHLIRLQPGDAAGQYRFERTWPADGHWMIRLCLGHPPAPATVATLRPDGTVRKNRLYSRTDGHKECVKALRKWRTSTDDDC